MKHPDVFGKLEKLYLLLHSDVAKTKQIQAMQRQSERGGMLRDLSSAPVE